MASRKRPEISLSFEDTHVLLWDTRYVNFEFVHSLNEVFDLQLACENDLIFYTDDGEEINCPRYSYYDESLKLLYVVIENPRDTHSVDPALEFVDKVLFVVGRDAQDVCHAMRHDVTYGVQVDNEYDIRRADYSSRVAIFRDGGVVQVDTVDFNYDGSFDSSLLFNLNPVLSQKMKKRLNSMISSIQNLFQQLSETMEIEELD